MCFSVWTAVLCCMCRGWLGCGFHVKRDPLLVSSRNPTGFWGATDRSLRIFSCVSGIICHGWVGRCCRNITLAVRNLGAIQTHPVKICSWASIRSLRSTPGPKYQIRSGQVKILSTPQNAHHLSSYRNPQSRAGKPSLCDAVYVLM
ncbi:hypothetical protein KC19_7G111700 [Ceratodon purpureus]|uniref:Secreted protein n=1 Tax=Ceratodon purpureus TaxID=3225 RepID=A0A8T0HAA8_CERPU|nr:hypothetical protein KC19_7G111700 [Ceratodon purpureus]